MRQLEEDISAYQHDEAFCLAQLEDPDLTPQETRTLQLRVLDLSHQVRHCRHRIETIQFQLRKNNRSLAGGLRPAYAGMGAPLISSSSTPATNGTNGHGAARQYQVNSAKHPSSSGNPGGIIVKKGGATPVPNNKRMAEIEEPDHGHVESSETKKIKTDSSPAAVEYEMQVDRGEDINTTLQRLGLWKCRLCSAPKYLLAGSGKSPAAPCKWPLKDISKMITHFTEMHAEHSASERCVELGSALAKNRGCFSIRIGVLGVKTNVGDQVVPLSTGFVGLAHRTLVTVPCWMSASPVCFRAKCQICYVVTAEPLPQWQQIRRLAYFPFKLDISMRMAFDFVHLWL